MNVLIVSHYGLPHVGGIEVLVDQEIRALVEAGHGVTHVTSDRLGDAQSPRYPARVRVLRSPAWYILEDRRRIAYPLFSPALIGTLWREVGAADVVHVHGFVFVSSVLGLVVAWLRGKRRVLTDHGGMMQMQSRGLTAAVRVAGLTLGFATSRLAQKLVAYNVRVLADLERLAGTKAKSLFLPYPVRHEIFHPPIPEQRSRARAELGWTESPPKVLFVGRLTADKGVLRLLEAKGPDFDLVLCGPGDTSLLGLPRAGVSHLPPRPQTDLVRVYHAADLLVVPSQRAREGFPLVVREALACGLRVVMSYEPGYEPYRRLPNLSFAELEPESIREAIRRALAAPPRPMERDVELDPTPREWIGRLYDGMGPEPVA